VSSTCDGEDEEGPGKVSTGVEGAPSTGMARLQDPPCGGTRTKGGRCRAWRVWEEREKGEAGLGLGSCRGKGRKGGACRRGSGLQWPRGSAAFIAFKGEA
jgi:hypothetical protein